MKIVSSLWQLLKAFLERDNIREVYYCGTQYYDISAFPEGAKLYVTKYYEGVTFAGVEPQIIKLDICPNLPEEEEPTEPTTPTTTEQSDNPRTEGGDSQTQGDGFFTPLVIGLITGGSLLILIIIIIVITFIVIKRRREKVSELLTDSILTQIL